MPAVASTPRGTSARRGLSAGTILVAVGLCLLLVCPTVVVARVMGIDYGTDYFKVALVAAGKPLDIVLNRDYKRKTEALAIVKDEQRYFGVEAVNKHVRLAGYAYPAIKAILGRPFNDPACEAYAKQYDLTVVEDPERHTPLFKQGESTYTPEEILAMQLQYARETASSEARHATNSAVITVPPFFDQAERQAVLDAASLVGVHVLSLINDGAAVALAYAIDRQFPEPQSLLFYDVGAGCTTATLAHFSTNEKAKTTTVTVKSYGYDRTLGGKLLDTRLQTLLGQKFMAQMGNQLDGDVFNSPRAKVKLLKEAERVKRILSTNNEARSSIESLFEGHDFRGEVTREELEKSAGDLIPRFLNPIDEALARGNATLDEVNAVVFVGGGLRVPFVQEALSTHVGDAKVAKNINGDEAAVRGAALHAATMSLHLKAKGIKLIDIVPYPVELVRDGAKAETTEPVRTLVFPADAPLDSRKAVYLRRNVDFDVKLGYAAGGAHPDRPEVSAVNIKGLAEAAAAYQPEDLAQPIPKVRLSLQVNEHGLIQLAKAEAAFNVTNPPPVESSAAEGEASSTVAAEESGESSSATTTSASESAASSPAKHEPFKLVKVTLQVESTSLTVPALSAEAKLAARRRFAEMDKSDQERRNHAEAVNNLESFIYYIREFIYEEMFHPFSTEAERQKISEEAALQAEWMEEEGHDAPTGEYASRHTTLKDLVEAIKFRHREHTDRPALVDQLRAVLTSAAAQVAKLTGEYTDDELKLGRKDISALQSLAQTAGAWLEEHLPKQAALALHETPVLVTAKIREQLAAVEKAAKKLAARKFRKRPAVTASEVEEEGTANSSSASAADEEETASSGQRPVDHDEL
ncbi:lumenal Hsp70 protein [Tieghemiomyces parasiticus]|uniref:Lumenal Hsp70 protein n=1 Tax=Tieghemiomyces parasiticus TaxID=78921 RepID=A0A9W8ADR8_9FUNG|nr:lumenal Hsp70 protein [Tieghemiomyces parasiticus]